MASFIKSSTHISIVFDDGESATIYASQENYDPVCAAIKQDDWSLAQHLAFPVNEVKANLAPLGDRVSVEHGVVSLDGTAIHNTLTERMLQMHSEGFNIAPMAKFLENLMDNPSYRAVNELYTFLEQSDLPITEDGHFIAYKRVASDFTDMYSHTMDNSPGKVVSMPRNQVNEDKNVTCSRGLHFCSRSYLPHYGDVPDSRVVMVKINPRDVVSIPADYNNAKGRCSRYEVIRDLQLKETGNNSYLPVERLEKSYLPPEEVSAPIEEIRTPTEDVEQEVPKESQTKAVAAYYSKDNTEPFDVFASPRDAQEAIGVDSSSISKVCRGQRNTAGGYVWKWTDLPPTVTLHTSSSD